MLALEILTLVSLIANLALAALFIVSRRRGRRQAVELTQERSDLRDSEDRMAMVLQSADLVFWVWEPGSDRLHLVDHGLGLITGSPTSSDLPLAEWIERIHPDDREARASALAHYFQGECRRYECAYRFRLADGHWIWLLDRGKAMSPAASELTRSLCGTLVDIQRYKEMEEELRHMALHDELTGLPNRRVFMDRLLEESERVRRHPGYGVAVAMLDVDHFKQINDQFGHDTGDRVLAALANTLRGELRANDLAARLGGEEFAVILDDVTLDDAHLWAERLRLAVAGLAIAASAEGTVKITVSIGIARLDPASPVGEESLQRADRLLYAAKHQGRNCVVCE